MREEISSYNIVMKEGEEVKISVTELEKKKQIGNDCWRGPSDLRIVKDVRYHFF